MGTPRQTLGIKNLFLTCSRSSGILRWNLFQIWFWGGKDTWHDFKIKFIRISFWGENLIVWSFLVKLAWTWFCGVYSFKKYPEFNITLCMVLRWNLLWVSFWDEYNILHDFFGQIYFQNHLLWKWLYSCIISWWI